MRLYNEAEDNIKEVTIENYSVFRNLFKSKYLAGLLVFWIIESLINW